MIFGRTVLRVGCSLLALMVVAGCASKPRMSERGAAPPKLRLDLVSTSRSDEAALSCETREYLDTYGTSPLSWLIPDSWTADPVCPPYVVAGEHYDGGRGRSDYFDPRNLSLRFVNEAGLDGPYRDGRSAPYEIGLALGGGGTKAAGYSMGILMGLFDRYSAAERDQMERAGVENPHPELIDVDIISSVSGGSYAALWYFSRLIDDYQISGEHVGGEQDVRAVFRDCLPRRYASLLSAYEIESRSGPRGREAARLCSEDLASASYPGRPRLR